MSNHDTALDAAFEASWPPAEQALIGGLRVGRGDGAGRRVSSASAISDDWTTQDIANAVAQLHAWHQPPLFRATLGGRLALWLADHGWQEETPTRIMESPVAPLAEAEIPPVTAFAIWPPLAIQHDLWRDAGIDATRRAVMQRVHGPKTTILGRTDDRAGGTAFVAAKGPVAFLHALEVVPALRRRGLAGWMIRQAARWAAAEGCTRLAVAVTQDNAGAIQLYERLGFSTSAIYAYFTPPVGSGADGSELTDPARPAS